MLRRPPTRVEFGTDEKREFEEAMLRKGLTKEGLVPSSSGQSDNADQSARQRIFGDQDAGEDHSSA